MSAHATLLRPVISGRERVICCHGATLSGHWAPNALEAIVECAAAGVPRLEVDVRFMADDTMVLLHDDDLAHGTTGAGRVSELSRSTLAGVRHCGPGGSVAFLEDAVEALVDTNTILQVDLKLSRPITVERACALSRALQRLGQRALVGSQSLWNLRALEGVAVALDPSLHLRAGTSSGLRPDGAAPSTLGVHGFWDDSPIAHNALWPVEEYLEARVQDLLAVLPQATEWMVDIDTILRMGACGLALGVRLHASGTQLAAWTVREGTPHRDDTVPRLWELGADTLITDCPMLFTRPVPAPGV